MADNNYISENPPAHPPDPGCGLGDRELDPACSLTARAGETVSNRDTAGGGECSCPLWDGHIIDAPVPPV
jgi:hypothetical protein